VIFQTAFRGLPFLLKDISAVQKGQPYYMGNRALRDAGFRSPFDAASTTQPLAFGATRNPWALDRSAGSSGGSCAAVAAGMVPVAHANDCVMDTCCQNPNSPHSEKTRCSMAKNKLPSRATALLVPGD